MLALFNTLLIEEITLEGMYILNKLNYWVEQNKEKNINFKDGKYWTFSSVATLHERDFPFMSISTINRRLKLLEEKELIIISEHNYSKWNHTKWYTVNNMKVEFYNNKFKSEEIKRKERLKQEQKYTEENYLELKNPLESMTEEQRAEFEQRKKKLEKMYFKLLKEQQKKKKKKK